MKLTFKEKHIKANFSKKANIITLSGLISNALIEYKAKYFYCNVNSLAN